MANEQNLRTPTSEEAREIGRKGGIASGVARRKKKATSQLINAMLNSKLTGKNLNSVKSLAPELETEDYDINALMIAGQVKSAISGNTKAFEMLQAYKESGQRADETDKRYCMPITDVTTDFVELYRTIHEVWNGESSTHEIITKGGRGSIKSNFWAAVAEETIYNDPQAHVVYTRRFKTDLRGSVFNQFKKTVIRHDRLDDWEFTTQPMMAKYKKTGQCVIFVGADKPISLKSYNLEFGYIKLLIHEECDEMAGVEQMDNIEDTFLRSDTPALDVKIFNPPKSANNFMNAYTLEKESDPKTYICHSYYYNVPVKWLGKRFFERAEWFKEHKPNYYKNNYLGEVTGTGGTIFENLEFRKITDKEIKHMKHFRHGLDWGYEHPQVFIQCSYDDEKHTVYITFEEWHKRMKNVNFAKKIKKFREVEIIADSADPDKISDYRDYGFDIIGATKRWKGGGRDYAWEWMQQLDKIVIDPERTPHAAKEFKQAEHEVLKDGSFSSEYPRLDEDTIMATIYALNRDIMAEKDYYEDEEWEDDDE